jgi:RNA polymerase sigma-70 factor (ECF subfamily)
MQSVVDSMAQTSEITSLQASSRIPPGGQVRPRLDYDRIAELIERVAGRDKAAFAELFRYFAPRIKAYGIRNGATSAAAEELAQEAMISVWRQAQRFDPQRAGGATWIFTIARNRRIDMWRRESRPEIDPDDPTLDEGPEDTPDAIHEARQAGTRLREAVNTLPREQAEILHKTYFEDKSHNAISQELGLPLGTVKSRVRLGLARLRVLMAGFDA